MGVVFLQPGGYRGRGSSAPWQMCQERSPATATTQTGRAGAHVEGVCVCVCVCVCADTGSLSPLASRPPAHTCHWLHSTGRQRAGEPWGCSLYRSASWAWAGQRRVQRGPWGGHRCWAAQGLTHACLPCQSIGIGHCLQTQRIMECE